MEKNRTFGGLSYTGEGGRLNLDGARYGLLLTDVIRVFEESLEQKYGGDGIRLVFDVGYRLGKAEAGRMAENGCEGRKLLESVLLRLSEMGWGRFGLESLNEDRSEIAITVAQSPFPPGGRNPFERGMVAGLSSFVLGGEVITQESAVQTETGTAARFSVTRI